MVVFPFFISLFFIGNSLNSQYFKCKQPQKNHYIERQHRHTVCVCFFSYTILFISKIVLNTFTYKLKYITSYAILIVKYILLQGKIIYLFMYVCMYKMKNWHYHLIKTVHPGNTELLLHLKLGGLEKLFADNYASLKWHLYKKNNKTFICYLAGMI